MTIRKYSPEAEALNKYPKFISGKKYFIFVLFSVKPDVNSSLAKIKKS
jgi:hypothetical protein